MDVYWPGLLNSVATDNAAQTTKSFGALSAKRNAFDPVPSFHEEAVGTTLLTPDKSPELTRTPRLVR